MDPLLKEEGGTIRTQWHEMTARKVLQEAMRCFDCVRRVATEEKTRWKVTIQMMPEEKCSV